MVFGQHSVLKTSRDIRNRAFGRSNTRLCAARKRIENAKDARERVNEFEDVDNIGIILMMIESAINEITRKTYIRVSPETMTRATRESLKKRGFTFHIDTRKERSWVKEQVEMYVIHW